MANPTYRLSPSKNNDPQNQKDVKKVSILIGPNGIGKTVFINSLKNCKTAKILGASRKEYNLESFFAGEENVKDDVDSARASYKSSINELEEKVKTFEAKNNSKIVKLIDESVLEANEKFADALEKNIVAENVKLVSKIKKGPVYELDSYFTFNGEQHSLKNLPTGARKLIHLYFRVFEHKGLNSNSKKLVLLDEIDSMLHPS